MIFNIKRNQTHLISLGVVREHPPQSIIYYIIKDYKMQY